jgi:hypothetical protein
MASTKSVILDLTADLTPVRRRSVSCEAGALLALGGVELALIMMCGAMRPDMGQVILSPYMGWKIGSLALLAAASCTVALRSFVPGASSRRGLVLTLGLATLAMIGGMFATPAAEAGRSLLDRLSPAQGILCAVAIVMLALPVMALLAVLMRRAAPVRPEQSAWAAGLAASTCGALIFTACCPVNDPLYIVVWYSTGATAVTAAARWLLPRRFRL